MGGARLHLLANVREQHLDRDDEEPAAVYRRDRTVAAQVLAAAARLDIADELEPAVAPEMRVLLQRREIRPAPRGEFELREDAVGLCRSRRSVLALALPHAIHPS